MVCSVMGNRQCILGYRGCRLYMDNGISVVLLVKEQKYSNSWRRGKAATGVHKAKQERVKIYPDA